MLDIIICANFGVEKLRGLENTRGQILEFLIEMAGHPYNRAGATAQPVISELDLLGSRDVIGHVTVRLSGVEFLWVVHSDHAERARTDRPR